MDNINQLFILSGSLEQILAMINPNDLVAPFYDAHYLEQLNGEFSFRFKVPANNSKSAAIIEGNLVGFIDLDGDFQLFEIKLVEEIRSDITFKDVFCEHVIFELLDEHIQFFWDRDETATVILGSALSGTRWSVGNVTVTGIASVRAEINNVIEVLHKMIEAFQGGEFKFRLVISGNTITDRFVDFLDRRGSDTSKRFEFSKDLRFISREVDLTSLKTALYGYGKAQEVPGGITRLRFDNITDADAGISLSKPIGQEFLEDPTAKFNYGRDGGTRNRFGYYENSELTDPIRLLQETNDILLQINSPLVSYEMSIIDLSRLTGLKHEEIRLGDRVLIIDKEFQPDLQVQARIIEIDRYLNEPEKDRVVLSRIRPLITDDGFILRNLQFEVNNQSGVWLDSAYKTNLVTDHSFENIARAGSPDADMVWAVFKQDTLRPNDYGSLLWWQFNGTGYVLSTYGDVVNNNQLALYDFQAAVVSSVVGEVSEPFQYVPINVSVGLDGPYTCSFYCSTFAQTTNDGNAVLELYACDSVGTRLAASPIGTNLVQLLNAERNQWKRLIVTVTDTLPVNTELIEIYITTDTADFKYICDGVQLVPLDKPVSYDSESSLYRHLKRFDGLRWQFPSIIGNITFNGRLIKEVPDTFRAYASANQLIGPIGSGYIKVIFDVEDYDPSEVYNTATSQYLCLTLGYYQLEVSVRTETPAAIGFVGLRVYVNGVAYETLSVHETNTTIGITIQGSTVIRLQTNDFVEIFIISQNNEEIRGNTLDTHWKMMRLG